MLFKIKVFLKKQFKDIKIFGIQELFRKFNLLITILLKIPIYIIAVVPCIIIRLISPWVIVRIEQVASSNYGDFAFCTSLYYCKKKFKTDQPTKKHIDLFYIHYKDKIFNRQLAKMWKRKLNFFSGYLLDPINKVNKLIPGWKIHRIELLNSRLEYHEVNHFMKKCQPLDFTPEEEIYGKKMLNKFGLKDDDKFVCFAIRDNAYQLRKIQPRFRDWSYHDYRYSDIDNFVLAAEELSKKGYYIFRMGVVVNKPFNLKNHKIIDYANSNLRSDFLDVYLGAKCSFCLSTGLGFDDVPYIFGRPIAYIIVPIIEIIIRGKLNEKFLFLLKHHILKKEKRKLSISEIFSHGVACTYKTQTFKEKGIELADNTPDEIKDLVLEMVENLESKKKPDLENEKLQKTFQDLLYSNYKIADYQKKTIDPDHKFHGQIRCRFSTKFLRENNDWLK